MKSFDIDRAENRRFPFQWIPKRENQKQRKEGAQMRITEQDKRTFKKVVDFMQRMDQIWIWFNSYVMKWRNEREL